MAMSIATFVMAAASGLQAVLYLSKFGTNARTDGFFVAFAVYTTFGVFSQTLRVTTVPLLVGAARAPDRARVRRGTRPACRFPSSSPPWRSPRPVSHVLAPGLDHGGRSVTAGALPVLGIAMALQLWAAGAATVLAVRDRFAAVAAAYIGGAVVGLVTFLGLMNRTGVQTLGWSMMAMALVTCAMMLVCIATSGGLGAERRSLRPEGPARGGRIGARGHPDLPRLQHALRHHPGVREPRGDRRLHGAVLRLPVRQLPGRGHGHRAGDVADPGDDADAPTARARSWCARPCRRGSATRSCWWRRRWPG